MPATARAACLRALVRWEKGRAFADEILHETLQTTGFAAVDRAFLMETFFGILRNLSELDFFLGQLRSEPVDQQTRAVLRLGLYQLFHMRIPPYAAVNETVALAGRARGLVNAILRRALREEHALQQQLAGADISVRTSHPEFLITRWTKIFGRDATERLAAWNNVPAPVYVRANGLKVTPGELLRALPHAAPSAFHPSALKVEQLPFRAVMGGLCYVQDPSTLMACDLLAPSPGETVLDACAAPGGKTTYLAELMQNEGRLIACDLYASRLARLRENVARLGAQIVEPLQLDAMRADTPLATRSFDRILVDAPCSNTGVIRRRVDVRWRLTDEDFIRMPMQQLALLRRMAPLLKPGGAMVYSTCSLEPEENEQVVETALRENPSLRFVESRCAHPFVHEIDGAFAAKFIRE